MKEGLWTVEFTSNTGGAGTGAVTLEKGRMTGGDAGYYYIGSYNIDGDRISGEIKIQRYNPGHVSVFGPLERGDLKISGTVQEHLITASGKLAQNPGVTVMFKATIREPF